MPNLNRNNPPPDPEALAGQPLTEAEHGIWLGQQLVPNSPWYNAAEAIDIHGHLDRERFTRALQQTLAEASALQRVFRQTPSGPRQYSVPHSEEVVQLDVSHEPAPHSAAEQWMKDKLNEVVDLTQGPLFCQALIKVTADHHIWYQRIHHIAADGYAFALLSQRVAALYEQSLAPRDQKTQSIAKPLGDYAPLLSADHEYQNSNALENDRAFWLAQLTEAQSPASLSNSQAPMVDWPLRVNDCLDSASFARLKGTAQRLDCRWSDLLVAAVATLLQKETAQTDLTLGVPVMNRLGTPALRVPAMVMNIIPLRIKLPGCGTWAERIASVKQAFAQARPHQRYRYEHLRRDLGALGGSRRLFGPVVNVMPFDRQLRFGEASAQVRNLSAGPVDDISFAFSVSADGRLRMDLEANTARYRPAQLEAYQGELSRILKDVIKDSQAPVHVSPEPFAWLAGPPLPSPLPSVTERLHAQVALRPDAFALIDGDRKTNYRELWQSALTLAGALQARGLGAGDRVALALPRGEAAVTSCLACLLCGAPYLFIDSAGPVARNRRILAEIQAAWLVLEDEAQQSDIRRWGSDTPCVTLSELLREGKPADYREPENLTQQLAYLIYTSGSTGTPKGVMIGQKALSEFVAGATEHYGVTPRDRLLQYAPLHFDTSVEEIFLTLCNGATLVIRPESMLDSVPGFLRDCQALAISLLDLPTAYWHELVYYCHATGTSLPHGIHTVIIGGEAALPERVRQWHEVAGSVRLLNTYGPSETTVVATCATLTPATPAPKDVTPSIGTPLPGRYAAVVDDKGRLLRRGETGELVILGAGMGRGYLHLPKVTAARFKSLHFPWRRESLPAYFTGDLARIHANGHVEYLGRQDDEIKISGQRINPAEVESAIAGLSGIREAAVTVQPGEHAQKILCAYLAPEDEQPRELAWLREQLSPFLPAAMLPGALVQLSRLPRNAAGKIDRAALPVPGSLADWKPTNPDDLSTEERWVIEAWQEVLGYQSMNKDSDFFLMGGQSLQTIQVANRLSARFGREVSVTLLFSHPTVVQLAAALAEASSLATVKTDTAQEIREDAEQMRHRLRPPIMSPARRRPWHRVLLTGATGFVGAQLLYEMLNSTRAQIICPVRARTEKEARHRLHKALAAQQLKSQELDARVEILLADLSKPTLGVSEVVLDGTAERCDAVLHNAAITSVMRDYQSLKATNLISTQTLLQLACRHRVPFHLVSTVAVATTDGLPEDFVPWHRGLVDGYQQSKWAAERSVELAFLQGHDVSVYRLGRVIGDVNSGYISAKDLVWNLIAASLRCGHYPKLDITEPWTPVDAIARAVVGIAQTSPPGVLNLTPSTQVSLSNVFGWLRERGYTLTACSPADWCERLTHSSHPQDQTLLGFFKQREKSELALAPLHNSRAARAMAEQGVTLPVIDAPLFARYADFALAEGLIPPPPNLAQPSTSGDAHELA